MDVDFIAWGNYILSALFGVEMILKLIGLGVKGYFREGFNIFDCVLVIVSVAEAVVAGTGDAKAAKAVKTVRVLRMFRVLRVAKLVR